MPEPEPIYQLVSINSILVDPADDLTSYPRLTCLCSNEQLDNILKAMVRGTRMDEDDDREIGWVYQTGYTPNEAGYVYNFAFLRVRASGVLHDNTAAVIVTKIIPFDSSATGSDPITTPIAATPGKYYTVPVPSFRTEHGSVRLSGSGQINISKLIAFVSEIAKDLPR